MFLHKDYDLGCYNLLKIAIVDHPIPTTAYIHFMKNTLSICLVMYWNTFKRIIVFVKANVLSNRFGRKDVNPNRVFLFGWSNLALIKVGRYFGILGKKLYQMVFQMK